MKIPVTPEDIARWAAEAEAYAASEYAAASLAAETQQRADRYASGIMDGASVYGTTEARSPDNDTLLLQDER